MSALFVLQEPRHWNYFSVVAGHAFKAWISAVVQNKDGEGEGHGRCDERIGGESPVERERKREREASLPVQRGKAGLAACQPGRRAHEEAVCGQP